MFGNQTIYRLTRTRNLPPIERLEEQGASNAAFAKEIDHLLTRIAEIEKPTRPRQKDRRLNQLGKQKQPKEFQVGKHSGSFPNPRHAERNMPAVHRSAETRTISIVQIRWNFVPSASETVWMTGDSLLP